MKLFNWLKTIRNRATRRRHQRRAAVGQRSVLGSQRIGTATSVVGSTVEGLEDRALLTPSLLSITRQNPASATTGADSLVFRATFSEAVSGVDTNDFVVNGDTTAGVSAVSGSGAVYDITVSGGDLATFVGTVGLDVALATITIPDLLPASPYPLKVSVGGVSGTITDLNVRFNNLTHTFPDDLEVGLVAPSGEKVLLFRNAGGELDLVDRTFALDDEAGTDIPDETEIQAQSYRPMSYAATHGTGTPGFPAPAPAEPYATMLSAFDGIDPNGVWRLYLNDDVQEDSGTLGGYTLIITTADGTTETTVSSVSITANSDSTALPSGEPATDQTYELVANVVDLSVSANSGAEAGQTVITVTATVAAAVSGDQTVDLAVSGTGITSGDYSLTDGDAGTAGIQIQILNGATTGTVTFTIQNDTLLEGSETATLVISNPSAGVILGATTTQNVAITDNESAVLDIAATSGVTEAGGAQTVGVVTLMITGTGTGTFALGSGISITADVTQTSGSATSGTDYTAFGTQTVTFSGGVSTGASQNTTVTVTEDTLVEGSETIGLTLGNLGGSSVAKSLGNTSNTTTITDNESATVSISSGATVTEGAGTSLITATLNVTTNGAAGGLATLEAGGHQ